MKKHDDLNAPIDSFEGNYGWLSNFYKNGLKPTVEHFYQAAKTNDSSWQQKIMSAGTPGKAKRLGQKCPMIPSFNSEKVDIMLKHVRVKFKDPVLADKLCKTAPKQLMESNGWHDNFWGNCKCDDCKNKEGLNMLGFVLMTVRAEIIHGG